MLYDGFVEPQASAEHTLNTAGLVYLILSFYLVLLSM